MEGLHSYAHLLLRMSTERLRVSIPRNVSFTAAIDTTTIAGTDEFLPAVGAG
jgi:hypothetical protein